MGRTSPGPTTIAGATRPSRRCRRETYAASSPPLPASPGHTRFGQCAATAASGSLRGRRTTSQTCWA
eukprot:11445072-Alexandrium_andersonii.AAC.1